MGAPPSLSGAPHSTMMVWGPREVTSRGAVGAEGGPIQIWHVLNETNKIALILIRSYSNCPKYILSRLTCVWPEPDSVRLCRHSRPDLVLRGHPEGVLSALLKVVHSEEGHSGLNSSNL